MENNNQEKSQEEMVKEAVEEAKKAAEKAAAEETEATAKAEADENSKTEEAEADENGKAEEAEADENDGTENSETEDDGTEAGAEAEKDAEAGEEGKEGKEAAGGRKLFGKKNKKDKKDEKIEELTDKLTRQMAEFDNFRKRTEKEKSQMYEIGAKDIIDKILPVIDDFERGFGTVEEEDKNDSFVQGMEMVYKKLMTTLEGVGVKPIEAVGQEFDPNFHNAVMHVEDENFGENIVAEEFQKGYTYRDSVVRHSMVKVAN